MDNSILRIVNNITNNSKLYISGSVIFYVLCKADVSMTRILYIVIIIAVLYIIDVYDGKIYHKRQDKKKEKYVKNMFPYLTKPSELFKGSDIVDFLLSTEEFSKYNQKVYREIIDSIVSLDNILKNVKTIDEQCEQKYDNAVDEKMEAINSFHSLIYSIPSGGDNDLKFEKSLVALDTILEWYLDEIKKICEDKLSNGGYSVNRKIIKHKNAPIEANIFGDIADPSNMFYVY